MSAPINEQQHATQKPLSQHPEIATRTELEHTPEPIALDGEPVDPNRWSSAATTASDETAVEQSVPSYQHPISAWSSELCSLFFSSVTLIVLIGVLAGFDGENPPRLPSNVTINALVSILIGILYITLGSPINSCLSQLKWNHFAEPRQLSDFPKIDSASRSVLGSAKVVVSPVNNQKVFSAAVLIIAIQAIGPFVQQIVNVDLREAPISEKATMPISRSWSDRNDTTEMHGCGTDIACNMVHLYDASTRDPLKRMPVKPFCPSANCTWDPFWTLAVCSQCRDATSLLQVVNKATLQPGNMTDLKSMSENMWLLPNGHYLDPDIRLGQVDAVVGNLINITAMQNQLLPSIGGSSLLQMSVIATPLTLQPIVKECSLQFCGQYIKSAVVNGSLSETVHDTVYFAKEDYSWNDYGTRAANADIIDETNIEDIVTNITVKEMSPEDYITLSINGSAFFKVVRRLSFALTGYLEVPDDPSTSYSVKSTGSFGWYRAFDPIFLSLYNAIQEDWKPGAPVADIEAVLHDPASRAQIQADALNDRMETIASVLTNVVRSNGVEHGQAMTYQLYVRVDWPWIALPSALLVLASCLLVWTIRDTKGKRLIPWSDDAIATVVHGMDDDTRIELRRETTSKGLSKVASGFPIQLRGRIISGVGVVKSLSAVPKSTAA